MITKIMVSIKSWASRSKKREAKLYLKNLTGHNDNKFQRLSRTENILRELVQWRFLVDNMHIVDRLRQKQNIRIHKLDIALF